MEMFKRKLILAPMAGVTDTVFRQLCKMHGADIVVTEMVSADGIFYNAKNNKTKKLIYFTAQERPIAVQLFGADADKLAYAAKYIEDKVQPDFIDLNSGCPAPKVVKKNGGAALLKNSRLFEQIVTKMVNAVSVPVTVKIRSGWFTHEWVDTIFAQIAQDCGAAAVALHPRSKAMGFTGMSFWERIKVVKDTVSIPVIGNGDIVTPHDAVSMMWQTGCDSVMIGRGACGNPWIFKAAKKLLQNEVIDTISDKEKVRIALTHLHQYRNLAGELSAAKEMKKHLVWYIRGIQGASGVRKNIFLAQDSNSMERILLDVLEKIS